MKIIIAGTRTFTNWAMFCKAMAVEPFGKDITEVVSGCARGADRLGERWANEHSIPIRRFPANWEYFGKSAGHIRNRQMAEYADGAIVFWNGSSPGSKNMVDEMKKLAKPVVTVWTTLGLLDVF